MPQITKSGENPHFYRPDAQEETQTDTAKTPPTNKSLEQALLQLKTNNTNIETLLQLMNKDGQDTSKKTEDNDITLLKSLINQGNFSHSNGMSVQVLELLLKELEKKTEEKKE